MIADSPGRHRTATFIQGEVSEDYGLPGFILHVNSIHRPRIPGGTCCCRIGSGASWKPCKQELERGFQRKDQKKVGFREDKGPVCSCPSLIQHWVAKRKTPFKTILDPTPRCASSFLAHRIMGCTGWVSGKLQLITSLFFLEGEEGHSYPPVTVCRIIFP